MIYNHQRPRCSRAVLVMLLFVLGCLSMTAASAQLAPAGQQIGNQASATYTDGSGAQLTSTSNPVYTTILQVASLTLLSDNDKYGTAGSPVVFQHSLRNTGNGTDSFALSAANLAGNFSFTSVNFYVDGNMDGAADNTTPITSTGPLAPGETFYFVAVAVIPAGATAGQTGSVDIVGTSNFDSDVSISNTDEVTVTTNAVVNVTKSINIDHGASPSGPYTFTFTYRNSGNTAATNLVITDTLSGIFDYDEATNALWSGSATPLTAAPGGDPAGIAFGVVGQVVTATITNIPAGASGTVQFSVLVRSGYNAGPYTNTGVFTYNNGAANIPASDTNTVTFTVDRNAGVTLDGDTEASIDQGTTVTFDNLLTNTGNAPDTFNITIDGMTFPAGTTYQLYQSDGSSPMMDSNGDMIPDTGIVAPGGTYHVYIVVSLPSTAVNAPYTITKRARSIYDGTKTDTAIDTLTAIVPASVDMTNNAALGGLGVLGVGAGPEADPVSTNSVVPGASTTFALYINNTSAIGDTYQLSASTVSSFASLTLPAGWSVTFTNALGAPITNTGSIAPGASLRVNAIVTVPTGNAPGNVNLYFRALSHTTNAMDVKFDRVTVTTVRNLTLTPPQNGQMYPGNAFVYVHTLTNNGNVTEGNGVIGVDGTSAVTLSTANTEAGFTSTIYYDVTGNGLDDADPIITSLNEDGLTGLAPGASITLLVKVYAPSGASSGMSNFTTVRAHMDNIVSGAAAPADATVLDTSTVIVGDLKLVKWQALADADGNLLSGWVQTPIAAAPGDYIRYRIDVTNLGTAPASSIVISDATPAFTTYSTASGNTDATGVACYSTDGGTSFDDTGVVTPANGAAGSIIVTLPGSIAPLQSATLYFQVRVNPAPAPSNTP